MYYLLIKDKKKRISFFKNEKNNLKFKILNYFFTNIRIFFKSKQTYNTRIKNRCFLTSKSRSVFREFHISRIFLRKYILFGLINGFKKSSW